MLLRVERLQTMALPKELDGDVTKIEGNRLVVARNKKSGAFIGFYTLTPEADYIRGAGNWMEARGTTLDKISGAQLVEMRKSFIPYFDKIDSTGKTPTDEKLKFYSTTGNSASWDSQPKIKSQAPTPSS